MDQTSNNGQFAARVRAFNDVDIYPVTCEELSNERSDFDVLDGVIAGGAKIIQLRDKKSPPRIFFEKATKFREITRAARILLIINDHADIAMAVEADGVHLGQDDLPIDAARALMPDKIVGASTHTLREALLAERAGADYINIGPIFPTNTKENSDKFIGPDIIKTIRANIQVPFTVMGGINLNNIDGILERGAKRIAMVTGITQAADIANAVAELRRRIVAHHGQSTVSTT